MLLTLGSTADGMGRPWGPDEPRTNKLVFIGRNLDRAQLLADFKACIV
jgi:G3E family GTPase